MDAYQATYDAVRSRISNGDIGQAIQSAIRDMSISHYVEMACRAAQETQQEMQRPSVLMRPTLTIDGDSWCALYGDDLQSGVAGFGNSPSAAMHAFDVTWQTRISTE